MNRLKKLPNIHQGFTLVELMVTIAIIGILIAIGVPLTSAWVDQAKVDNATATLKTAVFNARVTALRNFNNRTSAQVATSVCIDADNNINVILLDAGADNTSDICSVSTNTLLKGISIPNGITIKQGATTIGGPCLFAFNSDGMLASNASTSTCATTLNTITVGKNNETANINIV